MDEMEDELRRTLAGAGRFDAEKSQSVRKETLQMFDQKLKRYRWFTWACLAVYTVISICAIEVMIFASSTKVLIICAAIILAMGQLEVLMKLWYWIMNNKLTVLKEIKELQLQIVELKGESRASENQQ